MRIFVQWLHCAISPVLPLTFNTLLSTFNQGTFAFSVDGAIGVFIRAVSDKRSPGPTATSSGSPALRWLSVLSKAAIIFLFDRRLVVENPLE